MLQSHTYRRVYFRTTVRMLFYTPAHVQQTYLEKLREFRFNNVHSFNLEMFVVDLFLSGSQFLFGCVSLFKFIFSLSPVYVIRIIYLTATLSFSVAECKHEGLRGERKRRHLISLVPHVREKTWQRCRNERNKLAESLCALPFRLSLFPNTRKRSKHTAPYTSCKYRILVAHTNLHLNWSRHVYCRRTSPAPN